MFMFIGLNLYKTSRNIKQSEDNFYIFLIN